MEYNLLTIDTSDSEKTQIVCLGAGTTSSPVYVIRLAFL